MPCSLTGMNHSRLDTSDVSGIRHWILNGCVIASDSNEDERCDMGSVQSHGERHKDADTDADADDGCSVSSTSSSDELSSNDELVGCDDDLLIPTDQEIKQSFGAAQHTWGRFVCRARTIPLGYMPRGVCDPSIMLKDVPALPEHPSALGIRGVAVWQIQTGIEGGPADGDEAGGRGNMVYGMEKGLSLLAKPLACRLVSSASGFLCCRDARSSDAPRGLGILALCWSYILSMRLLELQNRTARYSKNRLQPTLAATYVASPTDFVLDLSTPASRGLLRWLCAVLAPELGWRADGAPPTWTARSFGDVHFVILTDKPVPLDLDERPPDSARATELLIELCGLFGLGGGCLDRDSQFELLSPYTAAFLAALALPLYRAQGLEPQLAIGSLERRNEPLGPADSERILQYAADLRYYMTLSADTVGLQSIMWSMFWQPDVQCNLVSPWLGGILDVLRPLVDARNMVTLVNTFALRRPRVALWWLAVLLLGSPVVLEEMVLWLETTEGRYGRGLSALSWPDITTAAWTGCPNSFWDQGTTRTYPNPTDLVSRDDVLRCRFNLLLQSEAWNRSFCWRPFGHVCKKDVEVDIWPSLEQGSTRTYLHWLWWVGHNKPDTQFGFRRDTGRFVAVGDDLEVVEAQNCSSYDVSVRKEPSVVAVGRMLATSMRDVRGDTDECIAALPGFEEHKWHKYWNILPSSW